MPTINLKEKIYNADFKTVAQVQDNQQEVSRDLVLKDVLIVCCRFDRQEVQAQQAQGVQVNADRRMRRFQILKKLTNANGSLDVDTDELDHLVDFVKSNPEIDVVTMGQTIELLDAPSEVLISENL